MLLQYVFGAGAVAGGYVGYKVGHLVGRRIPERRWREFKGAVNKAATKVKDTTISAVDAVAEKAEAASTAAKVGVAVAKNKVVETAVETKEKVSTAADDVGEKASSAATTAKDKVVELASNAAEFAVDAKDKLKEKATALWNGTPSEPKDPERLPLPKEEKDESPDSPEA